MKVQIKTSFLPLSGLGRIVGFIARSGKAIEGHLGKISIEFTLLEGDSPSVCRMFLEVRTQALRTHRHFFQQWINVDLSSEEPYTWTFTYPNAGLSEFRIYLDGLSKDDVIFDDYGSESGHIKSQDDQRPEVPDNTHYYLRLFRIYSFYDLLLFFFALISGIGAIFEIFNFLYTIFG